MKSRQQGPARPLKQLGFALALALLVASLDQIIKGLVVDSFALGESRVILPGLLSLTYRQNTGAAFSLLQQASPWVLVGANVLVSGLFLAIIAPYLHHRIGMIAAVLIFGGALGNLIDRLRVQYVVDYLDIYIWPVFNLADSCIVVGVVLFSVLVLTERGRASSSPAEGSGS